MSRVTFPEPSSWHGDAGPQAKAFGFADSKSCIHSSPWDSLMTTFLSISKMPTTRKQLSNCSWLLYFPQRLETATLLPSLSGHLPAGCLLPTSVLQSIGALGFTYPNRARLPHPVTVLNVCRKGWSEVEGESSSFFLFLEYNFFIMLLASAVQWSESAIYIHISRLSW